MLRRFRTLIAARRLIMFFRPPIPARSDPADNLRDAQTP
jgi:hypothetical protein